MTQSATEKKVLSLARKRFVRPKELEACGLSRMQLRKLVDQGLLQKTQRGLYTAKNFPFETHSSLAEVAARSPKAVICLLSALQFHELTTENPSVVYVMLPPGIKAPRIEHPRLDVSWSARLALASGIEEHVICGVKVKITSPAKTVVDCFKYRSKVGINVAIEALRDAWHKRLVTTDELWKLATLNRMTNVMRPYLDSIIA